jgi:hypothetical protein
VNDAGIAETRKSSLQSCTVGTQLIERRGHESFASHWLLGINHERHRKDRRNS